MVVLLLAGLGTKFLPTNEPWFVAIEKSTNSAAVGLIAIASFKY
jgi:hypothetical protein